MRGFYRNIWHLLCAIFVFCTVAFASNFANAEYICDSKIIYDLCESGYYMTYRDVYNGTPRAGNSCTKCPSNAVRCDGDTDRPVYRVTLNHQVGISTVSAVYSGANCYMSASSAHACISAVAVPTRTGYTFGGYYTAANGSGTKIINADGSFVSAVPTVGINGPVTLYARWDVDENAIPTDVVFYCDKDTSSVAKTADGSDASFAGPDYSCSDLVNGTYICNGKYVTNWASVSYEDSHIDNAALCEYVKYAINEYGDWAAVELYPELYGDAVTYTITYNLNGGTNNSSNPTTYNVDTSTIALKNPTKTGYTFGGWYTNSGFSGTAVTSIPKGSTGNRTLYAKWTPATYTITLDSKYYATSSTTTGIAVTTNAAPTPIYVKYNTDWYTNSNTTTYFVNLSTLPVYTGYTFGGFYTGKAGTGNQIIDASGKIVKGYTTAFTKDTTLYAKWTPNTYTVTLDSKYYATSSTTTGTDVTTNAAPTPIYVKYNSHWYTNNSTTTYFVKLSTLPQKSGYTFGGFYTGKAGTGNQIIDASGNIVNGYTTAFTKNTTLYAKWTQCQACSAGTGATCSLSVFNNTCTYTTSCKTGYGNIQNSGKYNPSCTPNTYTVSYKCPGPPVMSGTLAAYNSNYTLAAPTSCVKAGYTLTGWTTTDDDGNTIEYGPTDTFVWKYLADKRFNAVWTPICYPLKVCAADGADNKNCHTLYQRADDLYSLYSTDNCEDGTDVNMDAYMGSMPNAKEVPVGFYDVLTNELCVDENLEFTGNCVVGEGSEWFTKYQCKDGYWSYEYDEQFSYPGASCDPLYYKITLNKNGGNANGAPGQIYEKPNDGWYDEHLTQTIDNIGRLPIKDKYVFNGFFTEQNGTGTQVIASDGRIIAPNFLFNSDKTIYAYYTKCECTPGDGVSECAVTGTATGNSCLMNVTCESEYSDNGYGTDNGGRVEYVAYDGKPGVAEYTATCKKIGFTTGYTCPADSTRYISCFAGNYMATMDASGNYVYNGTPTSGNSCQNCPADAAYCQGGTDAPLYKVTFDDNGGTNNGLTLLYGGVDKKYRLYPGADVWASVADDLLPTHDGKTFNGYWTQSQGGEQYIDANGNFLKGPSANIGLHAQWTQCPAGTYLKDGTCVTCPSNSSSEAGATECTCNDGYMMVEGTCVEPEFTITTTDMAAESTFSFEISAKGTFYVDFDDGRGVQKIDRTNNTTNTPYSSAAYADAGTHTIKMYGDATGYSTSYNTAAISFNGNTNIKSVDGSLGAIFGGSANYMFRSTFRGCTSLQSIPETLFSGVTGSAGSMFNSTFSGCTSLQSIPETLFSGVTGSANYMFSSTFQGCTSLRSIPETLFSGVTGSANSMFYSTFSGCTSLQSIPETLFSGVTGSSDSMFGFTFNGCTSLQSIPETLFSGVTGSASYMFYATFSGCTSLQSIPETLFSGVTGSANSMFYFTFQGCTSLQSIPETLFSGVTGSASYMFYATFFDCTSLTSLPNGLFKNIEGKPQSGMFGSTFSNCSKLTGYIPSDMFEKMDSTDFDSATMSRIFTNTALDTQCPAGMYQYITGFESAWNGKVSCVPCPSNSNSEAGATECTCNTGYNYDGGTTTTTNACVPSQYTITLNDNGGTGGSGSIIEVYDDIWASADGSEIDDVAIPTRTGYTFTGYHTTDGAKIISENGVIIAGYTTFTENTTLYAQWTANTFDVYYDSGNSAAGFDIAEAPTVITCTYGQDCIVGKDVDYTLDSGYKMKWLHTDDGKEYQTGDNIKNIITENGGIYTLDAETEPRKVGIEYSIVKDGVWGETISLGTCELNKPCYIGCSDVTQNCETSDLVPVGYKVTSIEINGDSIDDATQQTFNGVEDIRGHLASAYAGQNYEILLDIYVEPSQYTVTFDANGGTGSMASQTFTYGEPQNLTANTFTRAGYAFAGWNTAENGGGTAYADKESISNLLNNITLYAQWTQSLYSCDPGYYWNGTQCVKCTDFEYYCPGVTDAVYGTEKGKVDCPAITNQYGAFNIGLGAWSWDDRFSEVKDSADACVATYMYSSKRLPGATDDDIAADWDPNSEVNKKGVAFVTCAWNSETQLYTKNCTGYGNVCNAGYYSTHLFPEDDLDNIQAEDIAFSTDTLDDFVDQFCMPVGSGYYSPSAGFSSSAQTVANSLKRYQCPVSTDGRLVESPEGADSADDCYVTCPTSIDIDNGTTTVIDETPNYPSYTCKYNAECDTGYHVNNQGTAAPSCSINTYTVDMYGNGGYIDGYISYVTQERTYNDGVKLTANTFTRGGYTFAGWNTSADGSGTSYADDTTENLTDENGATITLYAQWTQCAAGTYSANGTCVTCPKGSYCANGIKSECDSGTYADKEGMTECTACPAGSNLYKGALYMVDGNYGATSIDSCGAISYYMPEYMVELLGFTVDEAKEQYGYDPNADANKRGVMFAKCYYDASTRQYTKNCMGFITMCSGGYYTNVQIDPEGDQPLFETDTLLEMLDTYCMPVGTGYWSPELPHTDFDNLTEEEIAATWGRSACPTGLTTIGYGAGADEAGDCGRVLHVDGKKLYLRSTEKTDVSLHVKVDGVTFFGNMVVGDRKISAGADKTLKIKHNGQIYSVYDDSVN